MAFVTPERLALMRARPEFWGADDVRDILRVYDAAVEREVMLRAAIEGFFQSSEPDTAARDALFDALVVVRRRAAIAETLEEARDAR